MLISATVQKLLNCKYAWVNLPSLPAYVVRILLIDY